MLAASVPLGASAIPLMKFGLALMLIGGAIALASVGLAFLVKSLEGITLETGAAIMLVSLGLAALTFTAAKAGAVGLLAGIGMGVLFGVISAFVYFISGSETSKSLNNLSNVFKHLASIKFLETAMGIRQIAKSVKELAGSMEDLSDEEVSKIVKVTTSFSGGTTPAGTSSPSTASPSVAATTSPSLVRQPAAAASTASPGGYATGGGSGDNSAQIASLISAIERLASREVKLFLNRTGEREIAHIAEKGVSRKLQDS